MNTKVQNELSLMLFETAQTLIGIDDDETLAEIQSQLQRMAESWRNGTIRLADGYYRVTCTPSEMRKLADDAWKEAIYA